MAKFHYAYVIFICCCLIMGVDVALTLSCAGIFYNPVSKDLGITVGKFGLYVFLIQLFATLFLPFAGKLIERYSARKLLSLSSLILGLCFIVMSLCNFLWQFYITGAIIGLTMSFLLYLSFPTLINRWFNSNIGLFIGLSSSFSSLTAIILNPLTAFIIKNYGWRSAYLIFGVIILCLAVPILALFLRDFPKDKGLSAIGKIPEREIVSSGIEYRNAIKYPSFYYLFILSFLMMSVSVLHLFMANYAITLNYKIEQSALLVSFVMLGITSSKVILGFVIDKNAYIGLLISVISGICGLTFLYFSNINIILLLAGGFLFGWIYSGTTISAPVLVRNIFGSKDFTKIYANIATAFGIGCTFASGGWGIITDYWNFKVSIITAIGFLILSSILAILIKKSGKDF